MFGASLCVATDTTPIHRVPFVYKLWEAINSPKHLISWSEDGSSVIVDDEKFEEYVMKTYPDLVKIPTFANFRRQMKWYGFTWDLDQSGLFVFNHPYFKMDREDLLDFVVTRRKEGRLFKQMPNIFDDCSDDNKHKIRNCVSKYKAKHGCDELSDFGNSQEPFLKRKRRKYKKRKNKEKSFKEKHTQTEISTSFHDQYCSQRENEISSEISPEPLFTVTQEQSENFENSSFDIDERVVNNFKKPLLSSTEINYFEIPIHFYDENFTGFLPLQGEIVRKVEEGHYSFIPSDKELINL